MTRWVLLLVLACGCAKSLEDLYPFRCPQSGTCPLGGLRATCASESVGCTYECTTSKDCLGSSGDPRVELACVDGVCEESCTDEAGMMDATRCPDSYTCEPAPTGVGNGMFTCKLDDLAVNTTR